MTRDEVILADPHQRHHDGRIIGPAQRAWHLAVIQVDRMVAASRIRHRHRRKEPPRIGMLRIAEHRLARANLDDLPEVMTATRCATRSTTAMSCEMNRNASPNRACNPISRFTTCARIDTSSAATASSAMIKLGSDANARAMHARCRCPPDSSCG